MNEEPPQEVQEAIIAAIPVGFLDDEPSGSIPVLFQDELGATAVMVPVVTSVISGHTVVKVLPFAVTEADGELVADTAELSRWIMRVNPNDLEVEGGE